MGATLDLDELCSVLRACDVIELDDCTPAYLGDFLAERVAAAEPDLSVKLRMLDGERMDRLCECIKAAHAVVR